MINKIRYTYNFSSWLFLRILGLVYFFAFVSLASQVLALIGSEGILPAQRLIDVVGKSEGPVAPFYFPTLYWLQPNDNFLRMLCGGGIVSALCVMFGTLTAPALFCCWLFWLSLVTIGGDFLSFQWDVLLLEAGFLGIFLAPLRLLEAPFSFFRKKVSSTEYSNIVIWLFRWLLFRLMFESGFVKLKSGDPNWWGLKALNYHYFTQPLPTPLAWFADKIPEPVHKISVVLVFIIELLLPLLIFLPRKCKLIACGGFIFLQLLIAATGNYAYFNLLTIALALFLIDDQFWFKKLPNYLTGWYQNLALMPEPVFKQLITGGVALLIALLSLVNFVGTYSVPPELQRALAPIERLNLVNSYGLFAVMTTERNEIIIQGSSDGANWKTYEFFNKPGPIEQAPPVVAPFQPRLDWQMWFAALAPADTSPWFSHFMVRLFRNDRQVLTLLKYNPFAEHPPRYLRAELYRYEFSSWQELFQQGKWWQRHYVGPFIPAVKNDFLDEIK
ncbi:MAG: lipase maturation factor family protein [Candidatus Obscuribacterales bacterium]|nr:lipase maturation factor family protein [Candidatus Obscuribacterales bacterium]